MGLRRRNGALNKPGIPVTARVRERKKELEPSLCCQSDLLDIKCDKYVTSSVVVSVERLCGAMSPPGGAAR